MSQQQPIKILKIFKDSFACRIGLAANHRYPGNIQRLFRLKKISQQQPIILLKKFKVFFDCKIVLGANHRYLGNIQRLFRLQNCLSRKSAISWQHSKIFPPAKLSQQQPINILKRFKDFFACKNILAVNYRYPGNIQRLFRVQNVLVATHQNSQNIQRFFRLQNCLSRKSSISWKYSKTFSPAKLSQPQISDILATFKDFSACKIVLAATHQYSEKIQRLICLQKYLSRKLSISWKYSKTFSGAKCLSSNPSKFSKYSKILSPAELAQPQIIDILEIFKDFLACKIVLAATHHNSEKVQKLFRLQSCPRRKSSISWKYSKTFSLAKISQQQPINILKRFKDFFACKNILAVNYRYPGNIQRLFRVQNVLVATHQNSQNIQRFFRLQNWLSRKSSISWKYSKTFSPAKLSQQQPIIILKRFKNFFACKVVLAANHRYPGNIQRLFRLQNCRSSNPSIL